MCLRPGAPPATCARKYRAWGFSRWDRSEGLPQSALADGSLVSGPSQRTLRGLSVVPNAAFWPEPGCHGHRNPFLTGRQVRVFARAFPPNPRPRPPDCGENDRGPLPEYPCRNPLSAELLRLDTVARKHPPSRSWNGDEHWLGLPAAPEIMPAPGFRAAARNLPGCRGGWKCRYVWRSLPHTIGPPGQNRFRPRGGGAA